MLTPLEREMYQWRKVAKRNQRQLSKQTKLMKIWRAVARRRAFTYSNLGSDYND